MTGGGSGVVATGERACMLCDESCKRHGCLRRCTVQKLRYCLLGVNAVAYGALTVAAGAHGLTCAQLHRLRFGTQW